MEKTLELENNEPVEVEDKAPSLRQSLETAFNSTKEEEPEKAAPVVQEPSPFKPLEIWPDDVKQKFTQLPKEHQEFLLKRHKDQEADYTRKTQEIAPVRKVLQQFKPLFDEQKVAPEQVINNALGTLYKLVYGTPEQKAQEWMAVAHAYGVPLTPQAKPAQDEQYVDPEVKALHDKNALLERQLQNFQKTALTKPEYEAMQEEKNLMAKIDEFIGTKSGTGDPAYPFASENPVLDRMAFLARSYTSQGQEAPSLPQLYEEAVYSMPEYRAKVIEREQKAALDKLRSENQTKVHKAQKASSSITNGTSIPGGTPSPKKSLREQLEEAFASSGNRI
ncbi:MAG: hypothetical protein AB7F19_07740 [Candidatus Babeliales bacterium]